MTNAKFISDNLPKHVRLFDRPVDAVSYAQETITDRHEATKFHIATTVHGRFYLICIAERSVAYRWLCERGFHVHVER